MCVIRIYGVLHLVCHIERELYAGLWLRATEFRFKPRKLGNANETWIYTYCNKTIYSGYGSATSLDDDEFGTKPSGGERKTKPLVVVHVVRLKPIEVVLGWSYDDYRNARWREFTHPPPQWLANDTASCQPAGVVEVKLWNWTKRERENSYFASSRIKS